MEKWQNMSLVEGFRHYLILACIGYISGIAVAYFSEPSILFYTLIYFVVLSILLFIKLVICIARKIKFSKIMALTLLFIIPFVAGSLHLTLRNINTLNKLHILENDNALYIAKITSVPQKTSYDTLTTDAFIFKITNNEQSEDVNINIHLFFKNNSYSEIKFGDTVKFYAAYTPRESEYSIYQKSRNQVATFYVGKCVKENNIKAPFKLSLFLSDTGVFIRDKALTAIDSIYSYNPESSAVVKAILTGDKTDFSDNLYNAFSDAGFLHVAAISGMHVSILFAVLSVLLLLLRLNRKILTVISVFIILLFCSASLFTHSVLRASIMLILSVSSMHLNREYDSLTALFFSALIILIIYPYALFTSGFLLSFGATLGIIIFYRPLSRCLRKIFIPDAIPLSVSAFLGTAPFTLLFFDKLSFWSVITNLWIVPLVYIVFCIGMFSSLFYYVYPPVTYMLRYLCEPCIYIIIKTARIFSNLKFGIISPDYTPWCFYAYYTAFFFLLIYFIKRKNNVRP